VGRTVRVSLPGEVFTGTATDITPEGHLVVDLGSSSRTVAAGDVVHLRDPG
jgi:BirA family transcriptional regulator, biotin operon repressor / biotin---[acetyl-CoA-carboxylase] ligase